MRTLGNLLDNAIKHSPDRGTIRIDVHRLNGGPKGPVTFNIPDEFAAGLPSGAPFCVTSVSDEGIGVPTQYHSSIFDKFFSIKSKSHNGRKGIGLGLSFCKQVIEAHDGFIWLDSPISMDKYGKKWRLQILFRSTLPACNTMIREDFGFIHMLCERTYKKSIEFFLMR